LLQRGFEGFDILNPKAAGLTWCFDAQLGFALEIGIACGRMASRASGLLGMFISHFICHLSRLSSTDFGPSP
jgi:hypothetical protein